LKADPGVVLTAMGDVFAQKVEASLGALKRNPDFAERVQVTPDHCFVGLDAYQKVIASGVDVVLLASPPGFRPRELKAAAEAGKHIFAEKPMGTDPVSVRLAKEAVQIAKDKKLSLVAGFCWRYEYARREFFKRVHDGAIGEVRYVHATYLTGPVKPMPAADTRPAGMSDVEWQIRNWYNFVWLSGDGLVEQACHSVDKIMWAMKDTPPLRCVGNGGRVVPNNQGNIFDHIDVFYEWPNGERATMAQRQVAGCFSDNSDDLIGSKGFGAIKGWSPPAIRGEVEWKYDGEKCDMYQVEHNELFASIRRGEPINDGDRMTQSTLAAIMGRMAAYSGQVITWEQALNSQAGLFPEPLEWDMTLPIPPIALPGVTKYS
jgi:predicted dehydrogenase